MLIILYSFCYLIPYVFGISHTLTADINVLGHSSDVQDVNLHVTALLGGNAHVCFGSQTLQSNLTANQILAGLDAEILSNTYTYEVLKDIIHNSSSLAVQSWSLYSHGYSSLTYILQSLEQYLASQSSAQLIVNHHLAAFNHASRSFIKVEFNVKIYTQGLVSWNNVDHVHFLISSVDLRVQSAEAWTWFDHVAFAATTIG